MGHDVHLIVKENNQLGDVIGTEFSFGNVSREVKAQMSSTQFPLVKKN